MTHRHSDMHSDRYAAFARKARRVLNTIALISLAVFALIGGSCAGDVEKRKVGELRRIADQTPLYADFHKTGEKVVLKQGMVYLFVYYQSQAKFDDVKKFYDQVLPEKEWGPSPKPGASIFVPGEASSFSYRRGDYIIVVEQDEKLPENFDIVFEWDPL